ncbi:DUF4142 domain-containing protein [Roseococcus sp. DSY-14]|uniref:DUF4142 domain-containing protein n=1 Tax=Roseococcus sp. DSY-14 TaxID=3369650 RepID=UPI00387B3B77
MLHRRHAGLALAGAALVLPAIARAQGSADLRMQALTASTASLNSARLGVQRAQNPMVRQFAQLEAEEQMAAMEAMQLAGITVPAQVSMRDDTARMMASVQAAQGAEFDRAFLAMQKAGHEDLLRIHTQVKASGATEAERIIGTMAVPAIKSHLATIEMLMNQRG